MEQNSKVAARVAGALALAILLSVPGVAMAQNGRVTMQGHITTLTPQGSSYVVTLDNGTYRYTVPRFMVTDRNLRVGDTVRFDGSAANGTVMVDNTSLIANQPMNSAYGSPNLTATVDSVNRHLSFVNAHDETGRKMKIDVRNMDTRQSVNVWNLRPGDRIAVNGSWNNKNTFRANTVNIYNYQQPMTSSSGGTVMSGVVESINRNLNYLTVRNQATGQRMKIDVRNMDTRQSVNVWKLRAGDRITADGSWENGDTFRANRVNF